MRKLRKIRKKIPRWLCAGESSPVSNETAVYFCESIYIVRYEKIV